MKPFPVIVHIVDDDAPFRSALARLLRASGHDVRLFASAAEFLAQHGADARGCVVTDLKMPGMDGLTLQEKLAASENPLPIVFLTGHGDIPATVRAMRDGAEDFLVKTAGKQDLLDAVGRALTRDDSERVARGQRREWRARYDRLTPREREVFAHVIAGQLNKQIAADLGTRERTIKAQRASITQKLGVVSVAEMARIAQLLGIAPHCPKVQ